MKIEQLENLIEVVKSGSINAAAKKVFISQQSLNKSLHNLEDELGFQILNRTKRGVTLTDKGEILYRGAASIIERYYDMLEDLEDESGDNGLRQMSEKLIIHISAMLNISILPKAYVAYIHKYPRMQVYCQEEYRTDILQAIAANTGDVGFLLVPSTLVDFKKNVPRDVELHVLKEYPIYMAMSPRHPLSHHQRLSVSAVADWPLIVFETGGIMGVHAFQDEDEFRVTLSTSNARLCEEMLHEGEALMYSFPPYIERNVFPDFVHIPVYDEAKFKCYLAVNKKASNKERRIIDSFSLLFQEYL